MMMQANAEEGTTETQLSGNAKIVQLENIHIEHINPAFSKRIAGKAFIRILAHSLAKAAVLNAKFVKT